MTHEPDASRQALRDQDQLSRQLRSSLGCMLAERRPKGLLLSGGIDSSILAALSKASLFTVGIKSSGQSHGIGEDVAYAELVAKHLGRDFYTQQLEVDEAIEEAIPAVVKALESFDPAILNDIPVYYGLRLAMEHGCGLIMSGEGADELFGGYSYMYNLGEHLNEYIRTRIVPYWQSTATIIARDLAAGYWAPYRESCVITFSDTVPYWLKIGKRFGHGSLSDVHLKFRPDSADRSDANGTTWGKLLLREMCEGDLPSEVLWRPKADLMYGSGTYVLQQAIDKRITDAELQAKLQRHKNVQWWGDGGIRKLQVYLYEVFLQHCQHHCVHDQSQFACPHCSACLGGQVPHCSVCGGDVPLVPRRQPQRSEQQPIQYG